MDCCYGGLLVIEVSWMSFLYYGYCVIAVLERGHCSWIRVKARFILLGRNRISNRGYFVYMSRVLVIAPVNWGVVDYHDFLQIHMRM